MRHHLHPQILNHLRAKHDAGSDNITQAYAEQFLNTPDNPEDNHETTAETDQSAIKRVKQRLRHLGLHASGVEEPPAERPPHE